MRISFDLDDTLICYGGGTPRGPRLPWFLRVVVHDEPLRDGARELVRALQAHGHEVWIYTSSGRRRRSIRWWLRLHDIRVSDVVDGARHAACFGADSSPSKRPHAFGIDLHVDDSEGVAIEGQRHRFNVCVIDPGATDWAEQVMAAVERRDRTASDADCCPQ